MTDYKKLKAFAEELVPDMKTCTNYYDNEAILFKFSECLEHDISIADKFGNGEVDILSNKTIINKPKNLDKWIDETREYWRAKGLPSLQKNTLTNCSQTYADSVGATQIKTGKLYEMPNTVVHLKTQEEYGEYIQMCEDVGWKPYWREDGVYNEERPFLEIEDGYCNDDWVWYGEQALSLQELKERIGVSELQIAKYPYDDMDLDTKDIIIKPNLLNKTMNDIKNTAKRLLLTEPEKTYVKAGLMDIDKNWSYEAKDTAYEQMLAEYMDTKKFKDQITEVAKAIIEENK